MPTYDYQCLKDGKPKCGDVEIFCKVDERDLQKCPKCGGKLVRGIAAPYPIFKGSGFYQTDYKNKR